MALFRRARVDISVPHHDSTIRLGDGRRLAYAEYGQPDGKPVLWFHGTPGARWQIPPNASAAARERGFRLIGVDRPGVGGSTHHPGRSLLSFARDVEKLAAALGLECFAVIGLSGGGPYVLACAHEMPERVIVGACLGGIAPLHGDDRAPGYPRTLRVLMRAIASTHMPLGIVLSLAVQPLRLFALPGVDLYARFGPREDRAVFLQPAMRVMFSRDIVMATARGLRGPIRDVVLFNQPWPFSPRNVRVPIRFWHGNADPIVPLSHSEHLAELVSDSELFVLPDLGHFAGFVSTPAVLDDIARIWAKRANR